MRDVYVMRHPVDTINRVIRTSAGVYLVKNAPHWVDDVRAQAIDSSGADLSLLRLVFV
jgi:hypothetical protein